jgi:hypothetical protein
MDIVTNWKDLFLLKELRGFRSPARERNVEWFVSDRPAVSIVRGCVAVSNHEALPDLHRNGMWNESASEPVKKDAIRRRKIGRLNLGRRINDHVFQPFVIGLRPTRTTWI